MATTARARRAPARLPCAVTAAWSRDRAASTRRSDCEYWYRDGRATVRSADSTTQTESWAGRSKAQSSVVRIKVLTGSPETVVMSSRVRVRRRRRRYADRRAPGGRGSFWWGWCGRDGTTTLTSGSCSRNHRPWTSAADSWLRQRADSTCKQAATQRARLRRSSASHRGRSCAPMSA